MHSLTGARFVAAAAVLVFHLGMYVPAFHAAQRITGAGYVGVSFFFMLSGFVLTWTWRSDEPVRRFYGRRFARVWPLHALTTVVAFALMLLGLGIGRVPLWSALVTLPLIQVWWPPATNWLNSPSWSLCAEAFFYATLPLYVGLALRLQRRTLFLFAASGLVTVAALGSAYHLAIGRGGDYLFYNFPPSRLPEFAAGVAAAAAMRSGWRPRCSPGAAGLIVAAAYIVDQAVLFTAPTVVTTLVMAGPLLALITSLAARDLSEQHPGVLATPLMQKLGNASFALYLVHEMVLLTSLSLWPHLALAPALLQGALVSAFAITLAWVLHRVWEAPIERALRARWSSGTAAVPSPRAASLAVGAANQVDA